MSDNKVNNLLSATMSKIKEMIDVNTVMGEPVTTPDGTTVIPVTRVNYGFASGGTDIPSKHQKPEGYFGGGAGAGVTITPIAFLVISGGNVKVIQIEPFTSSVDRLIQTAPDVIDKVTSFFSKEEESETSEITE